MKTYIKPTTRVHEMQVCQLIANSLGLGSGQKDGSSALSNGFRGYEDEWDEEEYYE